MDLLHYRKICIKEQDNYRYFANIPVNSSVLTETKKITIFPELACEFVTRVPSAATGPAQAGAPFALILRKGEPEKAGKRFDDDSPRKGEKKQRRNATKEKKKKEKKKKKKKRAGKRKERIMESGEFLFWQSRGRRAPLKALNPPTYPAPLHHAIHSSLRLSSPPIPQPCRVHGTGSWPGIRAFAFARRRIFIRSPFWFVCTNGSPSEADVGPPSAVVSPLHFPGHFGFAFLRGPASPVKNTSERLVRSTL